MLTNLITKPSASRRDRGTPAGNMEGAKLQFRPAKVVLPLRGETGSRLRAWCSTCREPFGSCQRGRWSPRTGLTLHARWYRCCAVCAPFVLAGRALDVSQAAVHSGRGRSPAVRHWAPGCASGRRPGA
jgi:hypothetical protein